MRLVQRLAHPRECGRASFSVAATAAGPRRVVVTGVGLVTPLGIGTSHVWQRLVAGDSGLRALDGDLFHDLPAKVAGVVPRGSGAHEFESEQWTTRENRRLESVDFVAFALCAAQQAVEASGVLAHASFDARRAGVSFGCGIGSLEDIADAAGLVRSSQARKVSPFFVPRILTNMPAGHVSMRFGLQGPNHAVSTACAAGAHAIGDAFRFIKYGDADVMVAGGTESCVNPIAIVGFSRLKALSTKFNDRPTEASRPFDADRDGFVLGEGSAALVLEEREHALQRGAPILAEVTGYGLSGDAHHITAPPDEGDGARRCMAAALREARLTMRDVQYVNAHATSTPRGDQAELHAVSALCAEAYPAEWWTSTLGLRSRPRFVEREASGAAAPTDAAPSGAGTEPADSLTSLAPSARAALKAAFPHPIAVGSTKGSIGHLLGAAGAVEASFAILAVNQDTVPPSRNLVRADPSLSPVAPFHLVGPDAERRTITHALSNSFGFGGTNSSLVFSKHRE